MISGTMDYSHLIQSWIEYLHLEELSNLKIKKDSVDNFRLYRLNFEGSIITCKDNTIKITFHNKELLEYLASKREDRKSETFYLLFPLLEGKRDNEFYYYPLFIISFSEEILNFLKIDIDHNKSNQENSESIQKRCGKNEGIIDIEKRQEIRWFEKEINLEEKTGFITCKPVFTNLLKIDENEYESFLHGKSLITFLREFLALPDNVTFADAFYALKEYCKSRLKHLGFKSCKVSNFDFILLDGNFEHFQNERIKKQLLILKNPLFNPQKDPESAANIFLFGQQESTFDDYNKPDNSVWFGTFHKFPLSYGQALLLQKYSRGEKLIAVQGPPGTGKTTILMSIIAQTIVQRALSIVGGIDYPTVILVASTANKAVENAAREFKENSFLRRFPIYENGGFYFNYVGGQTKENFVDSITRLEKLKDYISEQNIDDAFKKYVKVRNRFISLYNRLIDRLLTINRLKREYQNILSEIQNIESGYHNLDDSIEELEKQIKGLRDTLIKEYNYNFPDTIQELIQTLQNYKDWFQRLSKSKFRHFKYQSLKEFASSNIEQDINYFLVYYENRSFIDKIINLFVKKEQKMIADFVNRYKSYLTELGFSDKELYNLKIFPNTVKVIASLHKESKELLNSLPDERLFLYPSLTESLEKYINLVQKLEFLSEIKQKLDKLYSDKQSIESHYLFPYTESSEKVFELWRTKYYLRTRALFILAMEILHLYAIMNKDKVIRHLELFIRLFSDPFKAREEIKKEGVQEFYRMISLVCPVYFSSLSSSPFIFDKFIYDDGEHTGLQEEFLKSGFKPVYLLFVDEAGMALPHLVYPALYWSERAICVGDPMQLQPVVSLDKNTLDCYHNKFYSNDYDSLNRFSPALTSAYHRAARCETGNPEPSNVGQACFLDYHRRCQAPIARLFCEIAGYRSLIVATPELTGRDREKVDNLGGKNLIFYDVHGIKGPQKNTNLAEIYAIKAICNKLQEAGYDVEKEVGIITPYVNQERLIKENLKGMIPESHIGTIHKFQGSEYPVIIMSTVVFEDNDPVSFIDGSPNLLNVAISRAKHLFIMIGSASKLKQTKYFAKALAFIKKNGLFIEGVEFDETDERSKNRKALTDYIVKNDQVVTVLSDPFEHMNYFKTLHTKVKNKLLIVTPWVKAHNIQNFSYEVLKELSNRGIRIDIVYGYSQEDQLEDEVIRLLKPLPGVSLHKMPNLTHAKLIIVDDTEMVVSSFNWLSHAYYKYTKESEELKALIRNEIGLLTTNRAIIDRVASMFRKFLY